LKWKYFMCINIDIIIVFVFAVVNFWYFYLSTLLRRIRRSLYVRNCVFKEFWRVQIDTCSKKSIAVRACYERTMIQQSFWIFRINAYIYQ
jgi:hypothetical protein